MLPPKPPREPPQVTIRRNAPRSRPSVTPLGHAPRSRLSVTPVGHASRSRLSVTPLGHAPRSRLSVTPLGHASRAWRSCTALFKAGGAARTQMASPAAPARLPEGGLLTVTPTARRYCQAPPRSVSSSATWGRPIDRNAYCLHGLRPRGCLRRRVNTVERRRVNREATRPYGRLGGTLGRPRG